MSTSLHGCSFLRSFPPRFSRRDQWEKTLTPFRATVSHHRPFGFSRTAGSGASEEALPNRPTPTGLPGWGPRGRATALAVNTCPLTVRRERRTIVCWWLSITTTVLVLSGIGPLWRPSPVRQEIESDTRYRTASGSDRIIFHLSFDIFHWSLCRKKKRCRH